MRIESGRWKGRARMAEYAAELTVAERAAESAASAILAIRRTAAVHTKADGSYVTDADFASDRVIRATIGAAFPDDAILTEEGADDPARLSAARCWLVDPIDGTASFVEGGDDFDVYIALVVEERPVVAVTVQPVTGLRLTAVAGQGAWITRRGRARERLAYQPAGATPRLGTRPWLGAPGNLPVLQRAAAAIGPGATVVSPDFGLNVRSFLPPDHPVDALVGVPAGGEPLDAWEWDIAAVDLIVREAGGCTSDLAGRPLRFNQPRPRFSDGLLLSADPATHERILSALRSS